MSGQSLVSRGLASLVTSPALRDARRRAARLARRIGRRPAEVHYFHQVDDPYSYLTAQCLPPLLARYDFALIPHLVPPPGDSAVSHRPDLESWSLADAQRLALATGLAAPEGGRQPSPSLVALANDAVSASLPAGRFVEAAIGASAALWAGDRPRLAALVEVAGGADEARTARRLKEGADLRARRGHYLGATFLFAGEWSWGVDRLHYLEAQLQAEGLARSAEGSPIAATPPLVFGAAPRQGRPRILHFFCSFRSPYTYLAVPRARHLAAHYGAELRLRFVLPMVMRGLPVPLAKRLYILRDAKREAERLGMRFGDAADPVGRPVERGLAVLRRAIAGGRGADFAESFLQGVFADGIDAGSRRGLLRIALRAGLRGADVEAGLADDAWRAEAELNRLELLSLGLWGVPCFRVDDGPAYWGQDRLWAVERDLRA